MKGRKPQKTRQLEIVENEENEEPRTLQAGQAPTWLSENAMRIWAETIILLEHAGRCMPAHNSEIYVGFCVAAATVREADEVLQREGLTICDGRAGTRRHPLISVRSQALLQLRSYAESCGLTPASAARLPLPPIEEEANPFADL